MGAEAVGDDQQLPAVTTMDENARGGVHAGGEVGPWSL